MTPAQQHMDGVASLGCVWCIDLGYFDVPACVHHCGTKMSARKDDFNTIPLCHQHHVGKGGIHSAGKERRALEAKFRGYVDQHCPCPKCKQAREA